MSQIAPDHFRYYATLDEDGVFINCERFIVIRETEHCYFVLPDRLQHLANSSLGFSSETVKAQTKRVMKRSVKRYCYPDKREALRSFAARQRWRLSHAQQSTSIATLALKAIEQIPEGAKLPDESNPFLCGHDDYTQSLRWE